ncbi:sigma-70 family RNA polymerase sigma factor [Flavobacterium sp. GSP27]|uniref:Sigma-70 family RNA polymerase sigma factor n=1 Tax=Flavobacterium bomense TaxID=2497483 RepID=A0A3S0MD75_9FLAO|nr:MULTISPECIES: sigma-70 family RNA polymerase sigma factor [Flavobacterium]RTY73470.1 sigma-70 family RNA polymerase sigma factor [Flavobacterium sp. LS1R10]RTZ04826.1 sigma-70 family RNA polymerase sigma factor [Flavobacterium bomense]RTZ09879.1 sigma-70 family RNA polymerase sigma factor [Flavobacterium sp. GSP27]
MNSQKLLVDNLDDSVLWKALKSGDEKAFSSLFKKYYSHLVRYGNSFTPFPEKVQDCVQDVFTDVWVYKNSLNDNVVVKAYLLSSVRKRIARLHERDHIFRKSTTVDLIPFTFDFTIEDILIADESMAIKVLTLNQLINNLPARQKEALYLRYHQGLSVEQIAELLGVNYQSANNLIHRSLLNIRKNWKENKSLLFLLLSQVF